jgi:signal recognition particle GTPase
MGLKYGGFVGINIVSLQICFWLIENNLRVLIAACDTFRAGAVEQLRTHTRHLNALHPSDKHGGQQMVQLYEKGYGEFTCTSTFICNSLFGQHEYIFIRLS